MAKLNMTQAAKAAGIARKTLYRHIEKGKISCETDGQGQRVIDTSELMRAYGEIREPDTPDAAGQDESMSQEDTPDVTGVLRERITLLEERIEDLRQDREERKRREDRLHHERGELMGLMKQQQARLLTYEGGEKRGFFRRLFGG